MTTTTPAATTATRRPVVLLPPDLDVHATRRGPLPRMIVQREYPRAILEAGGLPLVPSPYDVPDAASDDDSAAVLDQLVQMADALVLPGGGFDIDPTMYGEQPLPQCGERKPERTSLERALLVRALARGLPVLGICGGMQLMNVMRGGTLWQDLPTQAPSSTTHSQQGSKLQASHIVRVRGGMLRAIVDVDELPVNSTHHQGIKTLAPGLVASAHAPDGLVEAFEDPSLPFFVGVQWHPEAMREVPHRAIYRALVDAARAR